MRLLPSPLLSAATGLLALPVVAETLTVENTDDDGVGSLRQAIADAVDGDTIEFDPALSGATIRLESGELSIDDSLVIDGSSLADRITVSGDATGDGPSLDDSRVFDIERDLTVSLISLIIRGGRAADGMTGSLAGEGGGGINSQADHLTVSDCLVTQNRTGDGGAGEEDLFMSGRYEGGGIGGSGGGIRIVVGGEALIRNSEISDNMTGRGGSSDFGIGGGGGVGGGIHGTTGTEVTVENSTISGNRTGRGGESTVDAAGWGGGGGGIRADGPLVLRNVTICENVAGQSGNGDPQPTFPAVAGGLDAASNFELYSCTIVFNRIEDGADGFAGGILFDRLTSPSPVISNTIIAGNVVPDGGSSPDIRTFNNPTPVLLGVNLIGDNSTVESMFPEGIPNGDGHLVGTSANPLDPLLGPLQDNGGPTRTRLPLAESPAYDPPGGDPFSSLATDQRGFDRIDGDSQDIGAVEAPDYVGIAAARVAAIAAARAAAIARVATMQKFRKKIRKTKKKLRRAKRLGKKAKAKRLKKKQRKFKKRLRRL